MGAKKGKLVKSLNRKIVRISELQNFYIKFPGDVYVLAVWILANNLYYSEQHPNTTCRTTIHGLSGQMSILMNINRESITAEFIAAGFETDAIIELDNENHPDHHLSLIAGMGR